VATRVVLGHSGQTHRLKTKIRPLTIAMGLIVLSLATRISADVFPQVMLTHHIYAAVIWIVAAGIWAFKILPGVFIADDEE